MLRSTVHWSCLVLIAAGCVVWSAAGGTTGEVKPHPAKEAPKEEKRLNRLRDMMNKPITLERAIEKDTPLKDALEFLSDRFDFTIIIDQKAFPEMKEPAVEERKVQLPKISGAKLGTVLKLLLSQVDATYLVRSDYVLVTSHARANPADWRDLDRRDIPTVDIEIDKRPLSEALQDVTDLTGINIVLDARVAEKAKTAVSAQVNNVPIDAAVRVLADMADLKPVALDNVLYVTTKENAKALQEEQEKRKLPPSEPSKGATPNAKESKATLPPTTTPGESPSQPRPDKK